MYKIKRIENPDQRIIAGFTNYLQKLKWLFAFRVINLIYVCLAKPVLIQLLTSLNTFF